MLAERSHPVTEMDQEIFNEMIAEAVAQQEAAKQMNEPGPVDEAAKLLQDMVAMGSHIGLDADHSNWP